METIDYPLLKKQALWIGGLMDDKRLKATERNALGGVWNLLHALLDDQGAIKIVLGIGRGTIFKIDVPDRIKIEVRDYDTDGADPGCLRMDNYGGEYQRIDL
ncbi:MAG: hypothetical protein JRE28_10315 [Deltaproteobacteria bacterium]|nr:hypothetical protein [Deltaproteobacteria bacterium]